MSGGFLRYFDSVSIRCLGWLFLVCGLSSVSLGAAKRPVPEVPHLGRVVGLRVEGEIEPGMASYLRRVLEEQREGEILFLTLDTLGGRLDSALAIRDALLESKVTSVCWIHPRAISAGALIAFACDVIAVSPDAVMGAAAPIQVDLFGDVSTVDAKVTSFMRKEMATTAQAQGRPANIAEAMVDRDVEIQGLNAKGKLLSLSAQEALDQGVAEISAVNEEQVWKSLGRDPPKVEWARPKFAEQLARALSFPGVSLFLIGLGLLGIIFELIHPSHGASLLAGISALALFFFGQHVVHLAGWEELALIAVGLFLLFLEWLSPGSTVFGAFGAGFLLTGLVLALVELQHMPWNIAWDEGGLSRALTSVTGGMFLAVAGLVAGVRWVPKTRWGKHMVLETVVEGHAGKAPSGIGLEALVGHVGVALTDLRPFGRVEVIGQKADARLAVGFVRSGERIRVMTASGNHVVVQAELAATPSESSSTPGGNQKA